MALYIYIKTCLDFCYTLSLSLCLYMYIQAMLNTTNQTKSSSVNRSSLQISVNATGHLKKIKSSLKYLQCIKILGGGGKIVYIYIYKEKEKILVIYIYIFYWRLQTCSTVIFHKKQAIILEC